MNDRNKAKGCGTAFLAVVLFAGAFGLIFKREQVKAMKESERELELLLQLLQLPVDSPLDMVINYPTDPQGDQRNFIWKFFILKTSAQVAEDVLSRPQFCRVELPNPFAQESRDLSDPPNARCPCYEPHRFSEPNYGTLPSGAIELDKIDPLRFHVTCFTKNRGPNRFTSPIFIQSIRDKPAGETTLVVALNWWEFRQLKGEK